MHPHLSVHEQLLDTETEFGPTVMPHSPIVLRQLLDEFEDLVREQGAPVDGHLAPGISRETLTQQLGSVGLTPPKNSSPGSHGTTGFSNLPGEDFAPTASHPASHHRALRGPSGATTPTRMPTMKRVRGTRLPDG